MPASSAVSGARIYGSFMLWTLLLVNTLNFLDRQIVNILAEPIKRELLLADWQVGALSGLAFAIFYTVLGIPIARMCDHGHRGKIIALALFIWSGFTALCSFAQSFTHLLLARIGVGIGEAGCSPPAQSLIADRTPKATRAAALAFYAMGTPVGSLLGMLIGGFVAHAWGWRAAFLIVGIPGMALAVIIAFTLRDPRDSASKNSRKASAPAEEVPALGVALRSLLATHSFRWMSLGTGLICLVSYAHQPFLGSFFLRNHPQQVAELSAAWGSSGEIAFLGAALGLALGVGGSLGIFIGGRVCDRRAVRDLRSYATVPAVATLFAGPVFAACFLLPFASGALILLLVASMLKSVWFGPVFAAVQGLVHVRSRATATAILLFIINAIGLGLGPLCLGVLSDLLAPAFGEAAGLKWAMVIISAVALPASLCFWRARRLLADELIT